jgi:hypothetical protein
MSSFGRVSSRYTNVSIQYSKKDLYELRDKLLEIQGTMKDGKLPGDDGETGTGQDLVVPLLNRCLKFCEIVEEKYVEAFAPCPSY